jgi:uncharacterized phage protein gp47/JayE
MARTSQEIAEAMVARTIQRSKLTDLSEGNALLHLHQTFAEEGEAYEQRADAIRAAFDEHNASGDDLDDRGDEFVVDFERRRGAAAASGPALVFHRASTTGARTVEAGVVCGRDDERGLLYVTAQAFTFADGEADYPTGTVDSYVRATCNQRGKVGDAPAGKITRIVSQVSDLTVTQPIALGGGRDREDDATYLRRMDAYRDGTKTGLTGDLENFALAFIASDGTRCQYARIWESPFQAGYSELVVDDGFGFAGLTRAGASVSGEVPANGQHIIEHEAPATEPISIIGIESIPVNVAAVGWASQPERGIVYMPPTYLQAGDLYALPAYSVFTGFIADLQRAIEGSPSLNGTDPGRRNNGTRVRVVRATVSYVDFDIIIRVEAGADPATVRDLVESAIVDFLAALAPGEPLALANLSARLVRVAGLRSHKFNEPADDVQPASSRHRLGTTLDRITAS